jgi:TrmH family RNA methyltransferase
MPCLLNTDIKTKRTNKKAGVKKISEACALAMQPISSREHPFFKQLVKLERSAKQRRKNGLTLLDGIHLIEAYCAALGPPVNFITSKSGYAHTEIKRIIQKQTKKVVILSDALFCEASPVKTPTGIMAMIAIPEINAVSINQREAFSVMLESIQDPGNLGSILRSAAAAGVCDVFLSKNCADAWSPKVLRAAMGAHFLLHIYERSDLLTVAQQFSGKVFSTSLHAKNSLYQTQLTGPIAFVFGNEGKGLSDEMLKISSAQIKIPMPGKTESLNAAAAAAICLFESVRQRINNEIPVYYHQ